MLRACAAILLFSASLQAADPRQFPYEAVVAADDVEVRCGPGTGSAFYVTSKLKRDQRVTVHRHDPGGWYMIAPPENSFSYVEAEQIQQTASDRGVVHLPPVDGRKPARAIVWIGSDQDDSHSASGRQLSHGEEVRILDRVTLRKAGEVVEMYRIQPPPQEFRWVRGEFIIPLDEEHRQASYVDPYQVPADLKPRYVEENREQIVSRETLKAPVLTGGRQSEVESAEASPLPDARSEVYAQLDQIDQQYSQMMQREPIEWNLGAIEAAYLQLRQGAPGPIPSLIDQRLTALQARKEIAERFQRFVQLTSATDQRDAELAQLQQVGGVTVAGGGNSFEGVIAPFESATPPAINLGAPQSLGSVATSTTELNLGALPSLPALPATIAGPAPGMSPPGPAAPAEVQPRLDGAGIIQPTFPPRPDLPPYRLVAPGGRVLAYLAPEAHVPLHQMIGAPVGILGRRQFHPRLGLDVIKVQRTMPVRLTE